jgi:DNA-binding transcriptional MocR family regulator
VELTPGIDGRAVIARAEGVTARAGTDFGTTANLLRLSYSAAAPDEISAGIERLAAAMP